MSDLSMNVISQVNGTCQMQCSEVITVPDQPVYDQYFLEIRATNNLRTNFFNRTEAIG